MNREASTEGWGSRGLLGAGSERRTGWRGVRVSGGPPENPHVHVGHGGSFMPE